jgi:hypothetical protein
MVHPVCSVVDLKPQFDQGFMIYHRKEGLSPEDWQHVMDTQQPMITSFPETKIWNELSFNCPLVGGYRSSSLLCRFVRDKQGTQGGNPTASRAGSTPVWQQTTSQA